ncbi:hypothetical protein [Rhodonellum sp.]|uniref:hypothetical protein n=1 Tax=Rhodonellum sp. TaxID=2231180 RepID=UPI00271E3996|nr:hypothetical protein [Rhodonellum sp.]MDO9552740.1 hypothetical protein [Rhodonellum sp.]
MGKFSFSLILVVFLLGCNGGKDQAKVLDTEPAYFPIKEFIEDQAKRLDKKGVRKRIEIKGKSQDVEKTLTTEDWLVELDFFVKADINRSSLANSYKTQRSEKFLIHELKPGEKGKVKKIVVGYEDKLIKQISFQMETDDTFYHSGTRGVLYTHSETGLLDQFSIEGTQKVIFFSPNKITVKASVNPY